MNTIINTFKKYVYRDTLTLASDGYIGIPVELTVLRDKSFGDVVPGANGTPVIIYVINANAERTGTADDSEIIVSMLERGYAVILLDYKNHELSSVPALDYSVQGIRHKIMEAKKDDVLSFFGEGDFLETLIVPSGYDVMLSKPYWAFDKHGADGILEKITEIWNNDFKGTNAEKIIKWTDTDGNRKKTVTANDGSTPTWYNINGEVCENGEFIKLKHTYAENITDCVKPDGSFIDLNLYMHVIYPVRPKKKVPVMCLSSSTEHLIKGSSVADRPHFNGFLFRGYAGVMFDYGYTPMARADHYGYFDGYPKNGYVTGDNATYSMSFYNDKRIFTSAMRCIRYLALSDKRFDFDTDAIGVYGNSKGSWMTFLGEKNPEKFTSKRILAGHHDETRYEAGKTENVGIIRGGEEQPWLKYQNTDIKSEAELMYSSCGGLGEVITSEHCPMFVSCNRTDSSCYSTSSAMLGSCREHNVPTMYVDIPLPHTITAGRDLAFGFDAYGAFFDFTGYYLKGDAVKVVGIIENTHTLPYSVRIKFSGAVSADEVRKITLTSVTGTMVVGDWTGFYGGVEWVFTPESLEYNKEYTVNVPQDIKGDNGKYIEGAVSYSFLSPKTSHYNLTSLNKYEWGSISLNDSSRAYVEFEVVNDGFNRVALADDKDSEYGFVNTHGKGRYRIDITDVFESLSDNLTLKVTRNPEDVLVYESNFENNLDGIDIGNRARVSLSDAPDGTPSVMISGFETVTEHPTEEFYIYPDTALTFNEIAGTKPFCKADMGRMFTVSMKIYDTVSRFVRIAPSSAASMQRGSIDYERQSVNILTRAGEWIDVKIDYTVYELKYSGFEDVLKNLKITAYGRGTADMPFYVSNVKSTERLSEVEITNVALVIEQEHKNVLPYGQSDIVCKKSPWQK